MGSKDDPNERLARAARTFHNPLIAEAAALAKERQLLSATQEGPSSTKLEDKKEVNVVKKGKSRWADDEDDEGNVDSPAAAAAGSKRRRSPIVWQDRSKVARTEENGAPSSRPMTMAERAQAEVEEFRRRQAELAAAEEEAAAAALAAGGAGRGSRFSSHYPDISSPEEEMHIRREGNSAHDLLEEQQKHQEKKRGDSSVEAAPATKRQERNQDLSSLAAGDSQHVGLGDLDDLDGSDEEDLPEQQLEQEEELIGPEAGPQRPPPPTSSQERYPTTGGDDEVEIGAEYGGGYPEVDAYPEPEDLPEEEEERKQETAAAENKVNMMMVKRQVSMLNECRSVEHYEKLNRISEGTYGVVYRARDRETGQICALKKVKLEKERDGFPLTSVREINVLLSLAHPSIVNVSEVVVGSSLDAVFMVMEYADHDLKGVMEKRMHQAFTISEVKCLMHQLLSGVAYLHGNWVIHRDLKTSNILYTNRGQLKICDFGLARQYGEPLKPYTQLVVTLWYRSPELLLGAKTYSTAVDVWSCGCIMAELLAKEPLFMGQNELTQLDTIFRVLGCPTPETWPGIEKLPNYTKFNFRGSRSTQSALRGHFPLPGPVFDGRPTLSQSGFDLLQGLLELCPEKRISAQEALNHPWFREHPLPKDPAMMPTFPGTNESLHGSGNHHNR